MSSSHKIPHTITYSVAPTGEADGPLFIAGTFSKPEWLLQEMHPSTPSEGLINYSISIHVEPGKEYQYRFRHGREGAWTVDEKKNIVKSALGTRSNILFIKEPAMPNSGDSSVSFGVPLFTHERLGAYTLSDGSGSGVHDMTELRREISPRSVGDLPTDWNDPRIEDFPCDKPAILGELRKIQSSHGEQVVELDSDRAARRSSVDSDDGSSGSASPGLSRRRESGGRLSGGSNGRNRSHTSLGSIAEEPSSNGLQKNLKNILKTRGDNGEALMMRTSKRD